MRPKLLDLFCGAGGAAMGYYRAGFDVVGVDIKPQPRYPFAFIQGDALDVLSRMLHGEKFLASDGRLYGIKDFAAIHASPPCQGYSKTRSLSRNDSTQKKLIPETRYIIKKTHLYYVIENVEGAPLLDPILICGPMVGLNKIYRHRLFETNFHIPFLLHASHGLSVDKLSGKNSKRDIVQVCGKGRYKGYMDRARIAMEIDWMNEQEIAEAIPPAYTEFVGKQMLTVVLNSHCVVVQTDYNQK